MHIYSKPISEANKRSQRVIEKCGFKYDGTLLGCYLMYNGEIRDSRVYSMMQGEYMELAITIEEKIQSAQTNESPGITPISPSQSVAEFS